MAKRAGSTYTGNGRGYKRTLETHLVTGAGAPGRRAGTSKKKPSFGTWTSAGRKSGSVLSCFKKERLREKPLHSWGAEEKCRNKNHWERFVCGAGFFPPSPPEVNSGFWLVHFFNLSRAHRAGEKRTEGKFSENEISWKTTLKLKRRLSFWTKKSEYFQKTGQDFRAQEQDSLVHGDLLTSTA